MSQFKPSMGAMLVTIENHIARHLVLKITNALLLLLEHQDPVHGRTPADPQVGRQTDMAAGIMLNLKVVNIRDHIRDLLVVDHHRPMIKIQRLPALRPSLGQDHLVAQGPDLNRHLVPPGHLAVQLAPQHVDARRVQVLIQVRRAPTPEVDHALGHHQDLVADRIGGAGEAIVVPGVVVVVVVEVLDHITAHVRPGIDEVSGPAVLTGVDSAVAVMLDVGI